MTEEWLEAMNNGELTGVLMVDLRKAFDLVVTHYYYKN